MAVGEVNSGAKGRGLPMSGATRWGEKAEAVETGPSAREVKPRPQNTMWVAGLGNLDNIRVWLGTFQERLKIAHSMERGEVEVTLEQIEARYRQRRAELA